MKVQQELMRHPNIQTTMNGYRSAMLESKDGTAFADGGDCQGVGRRTISGPAVMALDASESRRTIESLSSSARTE